MIAEKIDNKEMKVYNLDEDLDNIPLIELLTFFSKRSLGIEEYPKEILEQIFDVELEDDYYELVVNLFETELSLVSTRDRNKLVNIDISERGIDLKRKLHALMNVNKTNYLISYKNNLLTREDTI